MILFLVCIKSLCRNVVINRYLLPEPRKIFFQLRRPIPSVWGFLLRRHLPVGAIISTLHPILAFTLSWPNNSTFSRNTRPLSHHKVSLPSTEAGREPTAGLGKWAPSSVQLHRPLFRTEKTNSEWQSAKTKPKLNQPTKTSKRRPQKMCPKFKALNGRATSLQFFKHFH